MRSCGLLFQMVLSEQDFFFIYFTTKLQAILFILNNKYLILKEFEEMTEDCCILLFCILICKASKRLSGNA